MSNELNKSKRPSEQALKAIEDYLDSGRFPEGSHLPPERQLATELGVSRRALREALGQLEATNRIWRGVGRGTIVGSPPLDSKLTTVYGLTSPTELMEARLALEPSVAALAAIHATTQDLREMQRCLKKSAGVTGPSGWDEWDGALHRAIGHASHNALITALFNLLSSAREHTQWGQLRKASLTRNHQQLYTSQHQRILDAIADRDAEQSAHHMRNHLMTVRQTLLCSWGNGEIPHTLKAKIIRG